MKYLVFVFIAIIFNACSTATTYLHNTKNSLTINTQNKSIEVPTNGKQRYQGGGCLQNSLFFEDNKVQIDYMSLKTNCTWTGLAEGYYQDFLRASIQGLEKSESMKLDNGNIYKFTANNQYFYLISLYWGSINNLFIIDYTGDITSKLLNANYTIDSNFQLNTKVQKSLLEGYQFKGFFEGKNSKEDGTYIPVL